MLLLNKQTHDSYYRLQRDRVDERYSIAVSFLDACVKEFLDNCTESLRKPDPGIETELVRRETDELIRAAGKTFMYTPAWAGGEFDGLHWLFHSCNNISSLKYEGAEGIGLLLVAKPRHPNIEVILEFLERVPMRNHRAVRKLLEMTGGTRALPSDSGYIYGIGQQTGLYGQRREDLFSISFTKHRTWEVTHADHRMMIVSYGLPRLPRSELDRGKFFADLPRVFARIEPQDIKLIWTLVEAATKQKNGTMLVISADAKKEADRLAGQSTRITPRQVTPNDIALMTSIDGAVMLDPNGKCYAVGVILDGVAIGKGDSSRGARYNSALRYVHEKSECLAVVISEDGMINLVPDLKPQLSRALFEDNLHNLLKIRASENIDEAKFNKIINWFTQHEFYCSPQICESINAVKQEIQDRIPAEASSVRMIHRDVVPSEEMDDSYFKE